MIVEQAFARGIGGDLGFPVSYEAVSRSPYPEYAIRALVNAEYVGFDSLLVEVERQGGAVIELDQPLSRADVKDSALVFKQGSDMRASEVGGPVVGPDSAALEPVQAEVRQCLKESSRPCGPGAFALSGG